MKKKIKKENLSEMWYNVSAKKHLTEKGQIFKWKNY